MAKTYKCTNYGICTEADKGTVFQETDLEEVDGKFVCPKCGQALEEIEKKPGANWKLIAIIAAVLVASVGAVYLSCFKGNDGGGSSTGGDGPDSVVVDGGDTTTTGPSDPEPGPKPDPEPPVPQTSYNLGWGIYEGQMQNGKPNGTGVVTVTKTYYIDLKNMSSRKVMVTKGDVIKGAIFKNGKLNQGMIHFANGERESINIGG